MLGFFRAIEPFLDNAYHTCMIRETKIYKATAMRDKDGEIVRDGLGRPVPVYVPVDDISVVRGEKARVFVSGIFNDPEAAARYAAQMGMVPEAAEVYLVYFPQADNALSELMVAGCQKFIVKLTPV